MNKCTHCKRRILMKLITAILEPDASKIANILNVSKSLVHKYMAGERSNSLLDIYFIELIFGIKVVDYSKNG